MRIKISKEDDVMSERLKRVYGFGVEGLVPRIAFAMSIQSGKVFKMDSEQLIGSDGREFRDDKAIFGTIVGGVSNTVLYKAILDQHYGQIMYEDDFARLFKLHLNHGLQMWTKKLDNLDVPSGAHIDILLSALKSGLVLKTNLVNVTSGPAGQHSHGEYKDPLTFELGQTDNGETVQIRINDLRDFDNRNIAIAGMAGSGKTQLVKDILYQVSKNTKGELKFIFFDYKGEGNLTQLKPFLDATKCEFVDIVNDSGIGFNPLSAISLSDKQQPFSIKAFVDTIAMFVPSVGFAQKNILANILTELFDRNPGSYPTINQLFEAVQEYYDENDRKPDTLLAGIQDLTTNIFNCEPAKPNILDRSLYLNLPPALSDTLRQLIVFLLLRYFNTYFSSTNDCEPDGYIFPLRYVIVIDEAHIYLKNKNARKALEELLRLLRSKGVIVIMLSQGVEDYKTKEFDFASQVKLPICLNVQNKDYKMISSFVGTPSSRYKLESELKKLESGKGLINIGEPKIIEIRKWWKTKNQDGI
jgi:DNA sulfur modification protein DndE